MTWELGLAIQVVLLALLAVASIDHCWRRSLGAVVLAEPDASLA
jgi:hypothetical protein